MTVYSLDKTGAINTTRQACPSKYIWISQELKTVIRYGPSFCRSAAAL
ncbi:MAG: hypothetical protein QM683_05430 [Lacrimispora sp.]